MTKKHYGEVSVQRFFELAIEEAQEIAKKQGLDASPQQIVDYVLNEHDYYLNHEKTMFCHDKIGGGTFYTNFEYLDSIEKELNTTLEEIVFKIEREMFIEKEYKKVVRHDEIIVSVTYDESDEGFGVNTYHQNVVAHFDKYDNIVFIEPFIDRVDGRQYYNREYVDGYLISVN